MSAADLSKFTKNQIIKHLELTDTVLRKEMELEITAMEMSPKLLAKNFNIKIDRARELYTLLEEAIISKSKKFDGTVPFIGARWIRRGDTIVIVSRTYNSLRQFLTNMVSKNKKLIKTELGIEKVKNKDGNLVNRSKFDIGHTVGFGMEQYNAVASARVFEALDFVKSVNSTAISAIQKEYIDKYAKIHAKYNLDFTKNVSLANNLVDAKLRFVYTVPQAYAINQALGQKEKKILQNFRNYIVTGKGSKSVYQSISEQLADIFLKGKTNKRTRSKSSVSGKKKLKPAKMKVVTRNGNRPKQLRDNSGKFISKVNLQILLQPLVYKYVKQDMDSAYYFKTLTNRFSESVLLTNIINTKAGVNIGYDYMKYPYEVFERGGRLHNTGREPTTIINSSIRKAAVDIMSKSFNIIPRVEQ